MILWQHKRAVVKMCLGACDALKKKNKCNKIFYSEMTAVKTPRDLKLMISVDMAAILSDFLTKQQQ